MSPSRYVQATLFWLMAGMSLAALAPALILPAWLEYRAALHMRVGKRLLVERLQREVTAQERQIRHLHDDAAYNERILREELGIEVPGVRTIYVDEPRVDVGPRTTIGADRTSIHEIAADDALFPAFGRTADAAIEAWPDWLRIFLDPVNRRWIMLMSGTSILFAMLVAGGPVRRHSSRGARRR